MARLNVDNFQTYFSIIFYILEMTVAYFLFLDLDVEIFRMSVDILCDCSRYGHNVDS